MKQGIHPKYYDEATVTCACGASWTTGATKEKIRVDVCANCHPFFTGEQRIVDTEGQVERFYKRLEARQSHIDEIDAREAEKVSPDRPLTDIEVGKKAISSLKKEKITTAGEFIAKLAESEDDILAIEGFGRKSLADIKKGLRRLGYTLPEDEA